MNRRDIITAAPVALLAGTVTVPAVARADGVTTDLWARWAEARAIADEAHAVETALEARDGVGIRSPEFRAAEARASDLWSFAYDLGREVLRTPVKTPADVVAKAPAVAFELHVDDFHMPDDADAFERFYRDLAEAYGVGPEVAAILDPVIAERDKFRANAEECSAQWQAEREAAEREGREAIVARVLAETPA